MLGVDISQLPNNSILTTLSTFMLYVLHYLPSISTYSLKSYV